MHLIESAFPFDLGWKTNAKVQAQHSVMEVHASDSYREDLIERCDKEEQSSSQIR